MTMRKRPNETEKDFGRRVHEAHGARKHAARNSVPIDFEPWLVEAALAVLRLKRDGDPDITDEQVDVAQSVLGAIKEN